MCTLLHHQAKDITLSARGVYYIIGRKLLHYQAAGLLHYRVMLLRGHDDHPRGPFGSHVAQ